MQQAQTIPVLDLRPEIQAHWQEYMDAIAGVLKSGQFIMGPNVEAFEQEVAAYLGVRHAIGVNSGTDALLIALRALGIGPGDEVITTPFTFFATAESISMVGATPVFVDIDPKTFNINPNLIEPAITERTKAILPVHLYGQAADMDPILALAHRYNLKIIEDVAQAFGGEYKGRKLGTLGDAAAFSFFPSKTLGGFGDGGMIATNNETVAKQAQMLRMHGSREKYHNEMLGYNSRLDELHAAILRVRLRYVAKWIDERRQVAERYSTLLRGIKNVLIPWESRDSHHVYHQYTVRIQGVSREIVRTRLRERRIGTMVYYPVPVHHLPVYTDHSLILPVAERAASEVLSLPIWPGLGSAIQDEIVRALERAVA